MSDLAEIREQTLSLLSKKSQVEIKEIQDMFELTSETLPLVTEFLVRFGFARFDEDKRHIGITEKGRKFFEEMGTI